MEQVLSRAIDDLEPTLTHNGYDADSLARQLNAHPSDIRAFLAGTLDPEHARELTEQLRQAGVPVVAAITVGAQCEQRAPFASSRG